MVSLPENRRGIRALALDLDQKSPALLVRMATGESRLWLGIGSWKRSRGGFANGLDRFLSVPAHPIVAASGAWTRGDVFTIKLALCETPFYSTLTFQFDGDKLRFDAQHNVAFGPAKLPRLVGRAAAGR